MEQTGFVFTDPFPSTGFEFNRKRDREPPTNCNGPFPGYTGPVAMEIDGEDDTNKSQPIVFNYPAQKRVMTKKSSNRFKEHIPLDLAVLNHKIEEIQELLQELYRMKEYFESKNRKDDRPCSYIC